ncbi:MAG: hypothetical protein Kow0042_14310 [Calditrichia bacterium]
MKNMDGLIICAGFSSRMVSLKPLVELEGIPFLLNIILKLSRVCDRIFIITGHRSAEIIHTAQNWLLREPKDRWLRQSGIPREQWALLFERLDFIYNPDYAQGMFGSLKIGLHSARNSRWILYHFVDQPHLPPEFYRDFIRQREEGFDWIQPTHGNKKGHPLILGQSIFDPIINFDKEGSLRSVVEKLPVRKKYWECPYPEVLYDMDTRSDVRKWGEANESL